MKKLDLQKCIVGSVFTNCYFLKNKETEEKNVAECIIAKQRNGPVGNVKLAWIGQFSKFGNLEHNYRE